MLTILSSCPPRLFEKMRDDMRKIPVTYTRVCGCCGKIIAEEEQLVTKLWFDVRRQTDSHRFYTSQENGQTQYYWEDHPGYCASCEAKF